MTSVNDTIIYNYRNIIPDVTKREKQEKSIKLVFVILINNNVMMFPSPFLRYLWYIVYYNCGVIYSRGLIIF